MVAETLPEGGWVGRGGPGRVAGTLPEGGWVGGPTPFDPTRPRRPESFTDALLIPDSCESFPSFQKALVRDVLNSVQALFLLGLRHYDLAQPISVDFALQGLVLEPGQPSAHGLLRDLKPPYCFALQERQQREPAPKRRRTAAAQAPPSEPAHVLQAQQQLGHQSAQQPQEPLQQQQQQVKL
jgi:hypothetical protein